MTPIALTQSLRLYTSPVPVPIGHAYMGYPHTKGKGSVSTLTNTITCVYTFNTFNRRTSKLWFSSYPFILETFSYYISLDFLKGGGNQREGHGC